MKTSSLVTKLIELAITTSEETATVIENEALREGIVQAVTGVLVSTRDSVIEPIDALETVIIMRAYAAGMIAGIAGEKPSLENIKSYALSFNEEERAPIL
jgi:hypothetical protein